MEQLDAIYARQSVDKADSISIESQIEFCRYEARGAPYRIYADRGFSGKNAHRPEFQRMLHDIRRGQIKRVICYKLDRCSRSIVDFAALMEELDRYHADFISCTEKFDTSSPIGRAMLNICIVFAQLERETIQQRITDAYHARSRHGFYMGGRIPFGFQLEPCFVQGKRTACYRPVETEAEILRFMYEIYAQPGASLADVINALQTARIRHPRKEDGVWIRSQIGRMLKNPIYVKADWQVYQYYADLGVSILNSPQDFIGRNGCYLYSGKEDKAARHLVLAPHEGIVCAELWLQCRNKQAIFHQKQPCSGERSTWLLGKLKCHHCGYALVCRKTTRKSGREYRYLACGAKERTGCPGIHGWKTDQAEQIVYSAILDALKQLRLPASGKRDKTKQMMFPESILQVATALSPDKKAYLLDILIDRITLSDEQICIYWKL